jgi:hypothetical protein
MLDRNIDKGTNPKRRKTAPLSLALAVMIILSTIITVLVIQSPSPEMTARSEGSTTLAGFALLIQAKDTFMQCNGGAPCALPYPPHVPNDVKGIPPPPPTGDNIYGTGDDCPHCSAYCAPASIAMIATYRGQVGVNVMQDWIYDKGKKDNGEVAQGDGIISTHGVGMNDGTGVSTWEVQIAFNQSIGLCVQHNQSDGTGYAPLTAAQLQQYIVMGHPVLWLDHNGFPRNVSNSAYDQTYRADQGHAKVIAGYNDNNTAGNTNDDLCLIYDPWPEYNDMSILPHKNATKGPGNTFDPYWLPLRDMNLTSDPADKYLVDTYPDIPEFSTLLLPIIGVSMIALIALRRNAKGDTG